jgi:AcrR family transcriptional regulator
MDMSLDTSSAEALRLLLKGSSFMIFGIMIALITNAMIRPESGEPGMKVSKSQAADNRGAILKAAAAQIRRQGLEHTSVIEVARVAGLTHGALYSHFQSKDALTAEAMTCAFEDCLREFTEVSTALSFKTAPRQSRGGLSHSSAGVRDSATACARAVRVPRWRRALH